MSFSPMTTTDETHKPLFMSPEHVQILNERLENAKEVHETCAALPQDVLIAYRMVEEDTGKVHWWQMTFARKQGVHLALGKPAGEPDVLFESDYWSMVKGASATDAGEQHSEPPPRISGDLALMQIVATAFETARRAARVPVRWPSRPSDL
jgi:hypothetical protein